MNIAPKDFTTMHKIGMPKKKKLTGMKTKTVGVPSAGLFKKKSSGGVKSPKSGMMSKLADMMAGND